MELNSKMMLRCDVRFKFKLMSSWRCLGMTADKQTPKLRLASNPIPRDLNLGLLRLYQIDDGWHEFIMIAFNIFITHC
jgi:hypothetical protein